MYVHKESSHPKHVLYNIPRAINKRLTELSSDKDKFQNNKTIYQEALKKSGYDFTLKYQPNNAQYNQTNHPRDNAADHGPPNTTDPDPDPQNTSDSQLTSQTPRTPQPPPPRPPPPSPVFSPPPAPHLPSPRPPTTHTATQPRRSQRLKNKAIHAATQLQTQTNTRQSDPVTPSLTRDPTATQTNDQTSVLALDPDTSQQLDQPDQTADKAKQKKKRKRNILYYNPPFSSSLTTKFGKLFLQLLDKHFPITHPLYPVMNRKKCKISFRVCPSMKLTIDSHNKKVLQKQQPTPPTPPCNCVKNCPIPEGGCRTKAVLYRAEIQNAEYIGLTCREVKTRIQAHMHTFRDETKINSTELSKYIWMNRLNRDDNGNIVTPKIKWSIAKKCSTYQPGNRSCDLCISEKLMIIKNINKPGNINKRTDCAQTCYHRRFYLSSVT